MKRDRVGLSLNLEDGVAASELLQASSHMNVAREPVSRNADIGGPDRW